MTLARKVYRLMVPGKDYRISDLVDMLYAAEREYMDSNPDIEEALNEEWLEAVQSSNLRQKVREALKVTRKFGYTEVNVKTIEAHERNVTYILISKIISLSITDFCQLPPAVWRSARLRQGHRRR